MSAAELEALLVVQEHDTARDRLRHRRAALPERAELDARTAELRAVDSQARDIRARRDAVLADERRLDDQARALGTRADEADARLYSGTVSSPRELQALQADVAMLRGQRSDLEDQELEIMEAREALDSELGALEAAAERLRGEMEVLRSTIAATESEIDEELAAEDEAWAKAAADVGETLLADYQRRRAQNKGAGAARLVGFACTACHLSIPSTEAERIRRAGGSIVAYCDNCSAILVP